MAHEMKHIKIANSQGHINFTAYDDGSMLVRIEKRHGPKGGAEITISNTDSAELIGNLIAFVLLLTTQTLKWLEERAQQ